MATRAVEQATTGFRLTRIPPPGAAPTSGFQTPDPVPAARLRGHCDLRMGEKRRTRWQMRQMGNGGCIKHESDPLQAGKYSS